jgi:hypothetical protein
MFVSLIFAKAGWGRWSKLLEEPPHQPSHCAPRLRHPPNLISSLTSWHYNNHFKLWR